MDIRKGRKCWRNENECTYTSSSKENEFVVFSLAPLEIGQSRPRIPSSFTVSLIGPPPESWRRWPAFEKFGKQGPALLLSRSRREPVILRQSRTWHRRTNFSIARSQFSQFSRVCAFQWNSIQNVTAVLQSSNVVMLLQLNIIGTYCNRCEIW